MRVPVATAADKSNFSCVLENELDIEGDGNNGTLVGKVSIETSPVGVVLQELVHTQSKSPFLQQRCACLF
jgi:hypothetical protein